MLRSLPLRGAWIEISCATDKNIFITSLPLRGAWIEIIAYVFTTSPLPRSLPLRGAWIEILLEASIGTFDEVAPFAGSVD